MLGCDAFRRLSRREAFHVAGAGLFGLTLADFYRAQAAPAGKRAAKARQGILLWLEGGPPHQDMFDMKPDRPAAVRGPFKPIKGAVPGLDVCEHLPNTAKAAKLFTVLRSVHSKGYPE